MMGPRGPRERPVAILAGGTGGHVFPALAVAETLRNQHVPVFWIGTDRGLEARVVPAHDLEFQGLAIGGYRRKGRWDRLIWPFRLVRAVASAGLLLLRRRPRAALGMGGFASAAGAIAALLVRIPLIVHEQNAVPGLANRWLARPATRVLQAFPESFPAQRNAVTVGNPVRPGFTQPPPPRVRFEARTGPLRLLVVGGSQGAESFNEVVPAALARVDGAQRPTVWHLAGRDKAEGTRERYREHGLAATVEAFVDDMPAAYAWADLAIARAGALTLAELTAIGLGAILVPYPYAVDDHQTANARTLLEAGGGIPLPAAELTADRLAEALRGLSRSHCQRLAEAAFGLAQPDAATQVAGYCLRAGRHPTRAASPTTEGTR